MTFPTERWAGPALIVGGLLMAGLWLVYTNVHGPTSYDETNPVLGQSTLFWGMLLGGLPNLFVALALLLMRRQLTGGAGRLVRLGYTLTLIGLIVPAAIDLAIRALGPPFFIPVLGAGLLLLASGSRSNPRLPRRDLAVLLSLGLLLMAAFAWAVVPLEVSDRVNGYRLYGLLAHLLPGLGWAALGMTDWAQERAAVAEGPA